MTALVRVHLAEAVALLRRVCALLDGPCAGMAEEVANLELMEDIDDFLAKWGPDVLLEVANEEEEC